MFYQSMVCTRDRERCPQLGSVCVCVCRNWLDVLLGLGHSWPNGVVHSLLPGAIHGECGSDAVPESSESAATAVGRCRDPPWLSMLCSPPADLPKWAVRAFRRGDCALDTFHGIVSVSGDNLPLWWVIGFEGSAAIGNCDNC